MGLTRRPRRPATGRRVLAAGSFLMVAWGTSTVGAQSAQRPDFPNGGADARADIVGLTISAGDAPLGFNLGRSFTKYQDVTASAQARAIDMGALLAILTQPRCNGTEPPAVNPATVPPITRAETGDQNAADSRKVDVAYPSLTATPGPIVGSQDAFVTVDNEGVAVSELRTQDIGMFVVRGGRSEARSWLDTSKKRRVGTATTTADSVSLLGGAVVLRKPVWSATAVTGSETKLDATFSVESGTVFGQLRTAAQLTRDIKAFERLVETALGAFGADFQWPTATVDDENGTVAISPMSLLLKDPPIGRQAIGPLLTQLDPLISTIIDDALDKDCTNETLVTLYQVANGLLVGEGSLSLTVGGAEASTNDDWIPPIVTTVPTSSSTTVVPTSTTTVPPTAVPFDSGGGSYDPGSYDPGSYGTPLADDGSFAELPVTQGAAVAPVSADASEEAAPIIRAATRPGSAAEAGRGAAVALGIVGLLAAAGLAAADMRTVRRGQRQIPTS